TACTPGGVGGATPYPPRQCAKNRPPSGQLWGAGPDRSGATDEPRRAAGNGGGISRRGAGWAAGTRWHPPKGVSGGNWCHWKCKKPLFSRGFPYIFALRKLCSTADLRRRLTETCSATVRRKHGSF